ncbi:MAG: hypothetical protein U1E65_17925 [Myxococcota bacterium]
MEDHGLHPIALRVLDSLDEDEESGAAVFSPSVSGLAEKLEALDPSDLGQAVYDLTGILLRLLDAKSLRGVADELGAQLDRPHFVRAYEAYLTDVLKKERAAVVASAEAFGRFRGGATPSSSTKAAPRDELLQRLPVRC